MEFFLSKSFTKYSTIINAIEKFYPKNTYPDHPGPYFDYPGTKMKDQIIQNSRSNSQSDHWNSLIDVLKKKLPYKVRNMTLIQQHSFNGHILLESYQSSHLSSTLNLIFSVSLLGPFFTIVGTEGIHIDRHKETIASGGEFKYAHANVIVYPSPNEFISKSYFLLRSTLKEFFENYKQIPYEVLNMRVKNMYSLSSYNSFGSVYEFLFDGYLKECPVIIGDSHFPKEDWSSGTKDRDEWKIEPSN